jgi:hypothetical protein
MLRKPGIWIILVWGVLHFSVSSALAQENVDIDHSLVLEIGLAGKWDLHGPRSGFGSTIAIDATLIEHWLQLEGGANVLQVSGHTELGFDLLFKKPYLLSRTMQFMIGLGPQLVDIFDGNGRGMSYGAEVVLDFMYWPTTNVGWYAGPRYSSTFGVRSAQAWGATSGILIGVQ